MVKYQYLSGGAQLGLEWGSVFHLFLIHCSKKSRPCLPNPSQVGGLSQALQTLHACLGSILLCITFALAPLQHRGKSCTLGTTFQKALKLGWQLDMGLVEPHSIFQVDLAVQIRKGCRPWLKPLGVEAISLGGNANKCMCVKILYSFGAIKAQPSGKNFIDHVEPT